MKHPNEKLLTMTALALLGLLSATACGSEQAGGDAQQSAVATEPSSENASGETNEFYLGEPRDDIERFFGLYGPPDGRKMFVTEAKRPEYAERAPEIPPGYLAIGAMWGDVAPMQMRSLSETAFEHANRADSAPGEPSIAEFEIGPDGDAVALTFTQGIFVDMGRLERAGDLPEKWR